MNDEESTEEPKAEPKADSSTVSTTDLDERGIPAYHAPHINVNNTLAGFFEIDRMGFAEEERINSIYQYLREKHSGQPMNELVYQLRQIESRIGPPRLGESRLYRVYSYVKGQRMVEDAERWRDSVITTGGSDHG